LKNNFAHVEAFVTLLLCREGGTFADFLSLLRGEARNKGARYARSYLLDRHPDHPRRRDVYLVPRRGRLRLSMSIVKRTIWFLIFVVCSSAWMAIPYMT
jgi:hypothetical protein